MLLKPSKFNYFTTNKNGDLLLFNSLKGMESLVKLDKVLDKELIMALTNHHQSTKLSVHSDLIKKGIFVPETVNENLLRTYYQLESQYANYLNLIIMPTENCNFRCTYCYEDFKKPEMDKETSDNVLKFIKGKIKKHPSLVIDWFGGEPLYALNTIKKISEQAINMCAQNGKSYISTMTTNGYLLTPSILQELIRLRVLGYQITLDGIKEIHDAQRKLYNGQGTFDVIKKNLIAIKNTVKTRTIKINLRTNFNHLSIQSADKYFKFLSENFEDDTRFYINLRYERNLKNAEKQLHIVEDDDTMLYLYDIAKQHIPRLLKDHFIRLLSFPDKCYAAYRNSMVIGSDGLLYKCTVHFHDQTNQIGCLMNGKEEIDPYKMSKWILSDYSEQSECESCFYSAKCYKGACPYHAINDTSNIPSCPFSKVHLNYILQYLDEKNQIDFIKRNEKEGNLRESQDFIRNC